MQAWIIIAVCAAVGGAVFYHLLRAIPKRFVRVILVAVCVTFFVVPAPIPGHAGELSPAFVVMIFESFFQIDGQPETSIRILLISTLLVSLVVFLGHWIYQRLIQSKPASEADPESN